MTRRLRRLPVTAAERCEECAPTGQCRRCRKDEPAYCAVCFEQVKLLAVQGQALARVMRAAQIPLRAVRTVAGDHDLPTCVAALQQVLDLFHEALLRYEGSEEGSGSRGQGPGDHGDTEEDEQ